MSGSYWRFLFAGCVVCLIPLARDAVAADVYWRGDYLPPPPGGQTYWFDTDDWWSSGTTPGPSDRACFTGLETHANRIPDGSVFTLGLDGDIDVDSFQWTSGKFDVTMDLNGHKLTTSVRSSISGFGPEGIVVRLTGGAAHFADVHAGHTAGTVGTLHVYGAGTSLAIPDTVGAVVRFGNDGSGTLHVQAGATYSSLRTTVAGSGADSNGHIHVEGSNSLLSVQGNNVWFGDFGSATLLIEDGAKVTTNGYISFGQRGGEQQVVSGLITGLGSLLETTTTNSTRGVILGGSTLGSTLASQGAVHVTVADEGRIESSRLVYLRSAGTLTVDNGTVTAGTNFLADPGSAVEFILHTANRDARIQAGNDVQIDEDVMLTLSLGPEADFVYGEFVELIQYGGALVGTFANYAEDDTFFLDGDAFEFRFTYTGGLDQDTIGLVVIPEPGVLGLLLLSLGVFAVARSRH